MNLYSAGSESHAKIWQLQKVRPKLYGGSVIKAYTTSNLLAELIHAFQEPLSPNVVYEP